jgi:hypothetical protein
MTALTHIGTIAGASTPKSGKRLALVSLAAIALLIAATAGLAYSQLGRAQLSALNSDTDIGSMPASRKVRCIMPPAWRKDCGA